MKIKYSLLSVLFLLVSSFCTTVYGKTITVIANSNTSDNPLYKVSESITISTIFFGADILASVKGVTGDCYYAQSGGLKIGVGGSISFSLESSRTYHFSSVSISARSSSESAQLGFKVGSDEYSYQTVGTTATTCTFSSIDKDVSEISLCSDKACYIASITFELVMSTKLEFGQYVDCKKVFVNINDASFLRQATLTSGGTAVVGNVGYSSSDTGVASVNPSTGKVTAKSEGTTTITAQFPGNEDYSQSSSSYELEVVASNIIPIYLEEGQFSDNKYSVSFQSYPLSLTISRTSGTLSLDKVRSDAVYDFRASNGCKIASVRIGTGEFIGNSLSSSKVFDEGGTEITGDVSLSLTQAGTPNVNTYSVSGTDGVPGLSFSMASTMSLSYILVELVPERKYSVTINSKSVNGWTTLYLGYPTIVPEGCAAYYATSYDTENNSVGLTKVDGRVAANEGVIVAGRAGSSYDFVETFVTTEGPVTNFLCSKDTPEKSGFEWFFLSTDGKFWRLNPADKGRMGANKAYLYIPFTSGSSTKDMTFFFDDNPSSISQDAVLSPSCSPSERTFNLSGQVVGPDFKGIVIRNGKKYFKVGSINSPKK